MAVRRRMLVFRQFSHNARKHKYKLFILILKWNFVQCIKTGTLFIFEWYVCVTKIYVDFNSQYLGLVSEHFSHTKQCLALVIHIYIYIYKIKKKSVIWSSVELHSPVQHHRTITQQTHLSLPLYWAPGYKTELLISRIWEKKFCPMVILTKKKTQTSGVLARLSMPSNLPNLSVAQIHVFCFKKAPSCSWKQLGGFLLTITNTEYA